MRSETRDVFYDRCTMLSLKWKLHCSKNGEQAREENSSEDSGNEHGCGHHTSCDLVLWIVLWTWRVHHRQWTQVAWSIAHDHGYAPVNVVVVNVNGQITRDTQRLIVAEKEKWDESSTENHRPDEESWRRLLRNNKYPCGLALYHLSTHPFHPRCGQTAKHRKHVERKEARDARK